MEFWIFVLVVGGLAVWYFRRRNRYSDYRDVEYNDDGYDDDDDDDFDEFEDEFEKQESDWITKDFLYGTGHHEKGFVVLKGCYDISLAGVNHPDNAAKAFLSSALSAKPVGYIDRQTDNPHDPYAIAISASSGIGKKVYKLGYIPRGLAETIRTTFSDDMPLMVEFRTAGFKQGEDAVFISVNLLGPGAAKRKQFLL